jgi:NitT/TauT family transport system substrate-binding protein
METMPPMRLVKVPALLAPVTAIVTTAAIVGAVAAAPAAAADAVVMRLNFSPWGMHAPYFGGRGQGFYRDERIELEMRAPSAGQQGELLVGTGREQFGITNADSFIKAKASGVPIVAIMADEPDNPYSVITLRKSGIDTPEKLKGRKIAWFQALVEGLLDPVIAAGGLHRGDVQLVTVARGAEVQMLAAGQVDALFGYSFGQALTLEHRGFPVNVMPVRDYGVQVYGTVIYTSEALLRSNPDLVKRFLRASVKGFIYAHDHPEDAVKETLLAAPDREAPLETQKLRIIFRLYDTPDYAQRFGTMTDAKWQSSIALFANSGDLARTPAPSEMYTNAVLDQLPETQTLAALVKTPPK